MTSTDSWTTWIPVVAAFVAAGAAIAVAVVSAWFQRDARKAEDLARRRERSIDHTRKQLDELYGEMYLLRSTSQRQWSRLFPPDTEFRLIDHIAEIQKEPSDTRRLVVEQVLEINARLAKLIETKASLLTELPPPESFMAFLDHQRALATLWELGENAKGPEPSFPRNLDADIDKAVASLQARLRDLGD
jgi:hypothetical protein